MQKEKKPSDQEERLKLTKSDAKRAQTEQHNNSQDTQNDTKNGLTQQGLTLNKVGSKLN